MKRRIVCAAFAVCLSSVWAYLPPVDAQQGVTLALSDFPDTSTVERVNLRQVPAHQPLTFTATVKNESKELVSGTITFWLNDDWEMISSSQVKIELAAGQQRTIECEAKARASVLAAAYPVHARFRGRVGEQALELHPIALFMVDKQSVPAVKKTVDTCTTLSREGVVRLDKISWMTRVNHAGKTTDLGSGFSSSDPASGACSTRGINARNGLAMGGFNIHPPYRGSSGSVWNEYTFQLPKITPIALSFNTAIRDSAPQEPLSDGVEFKVLVRTEQGESRELFTRFSAAKSWEPATVDLSAYAGQRIVLSLWGGPGPKNNTTCDSAFWGNPCLRVGAAPAVVSEAEWKVREAHAVQKAKAAIHAKPERGSGAFQLNVNGTVYGAALALGAQGVMDGVLAFSDGTRALTYRGFVCEIDHARVGNAEAAQAVSSVKLDATRNAWIVDHVVACASGTVTARARFEVDGGALRIAWTLPGQARDLRGTPRFTKLGIGSASEKAWRFYAGFGNVVEDPGDFRLSGGGFTLSTRHIGVDYPNGMSLVQACDIYPDHAIHESRSQRLALETQHDATVMFVPSSKGAFDAARAYAAITGFEKGRGVDSVLGRMCIDQWGGDYREAANGLTLAGKYGLQHSVFVKHVWQRWGYDYRLPEIYPPQGGLEPFVEMRQAAEKEGMLFCPHDNYIDFYPDAADYSYDHICFTEEGQPIRAWYNKGRGALSYRWAPHAFRPWLKENMRVMRKNFSPDALFIDVFTAIPPFDYYDREGNFHPRMETQKAWRDAFDTSRSILKSGSTMISEAGTDALIGSLDAGQADHFGAKRWFSDFSDSERTPWHDMASHGKMVLFAGGLGPRYAAQSWDEDGDNQLHGYGSDDYLSNTVMGGRNPMCHGPFSRHTVMTYWLLHDVCDVLARSTFETHQFGSTIHQQKTTFSKGSTVWVNRGSNAVWTVADGKQLPRYGFYVDTPSAKAGIVTIDGQRAAFARTEKAFFVDARPLSNPTGSVKIESRVTEGRYMGKGTFEVAVQVKVYEPVAGYYPFVHICSDGVKNGEQIAFQAALPIDQAALAKPGTYSCVIKVNVPADRAEDTYHVRYGFYRPKHGDRLALVGTTDGSQRIKAGTLRVTRQNGTITSGTYGSEDNQELARAGVNVLGRMVNFGAISTDGAFRLVRVDDNVWDLIPLPGSRAFAADISLEVFGSVYLKGKDVQVIDPISDASQKPAWSVEGATFRIQCDGRAFAYRITLQ